MNKKNGLTYAGNGAFLQGVPARDLTPEEVSKLSPELKAKAIESGLYIEPLQEKQEEKDVKDE